MQRISLVVLLLASLWGALPAGSPFRSLFDRVGEDPGSGGVITTADPDTDPIMINTPPPRG